MQVFSGRYGSRMANLMGIQDDNFRGGARVTFGDFNGDGTPDLAVATGFLGGPRVAVFDGLSVLAGRPAKLEHSSGSCGGWRAATARERLTRRPLPRGRGSPDEPEIGSRANTASF